MTTFTLIALSLTAFLLARAALARAAQVAPCRRYNGTNRETRH